MEGKNNLLTSKVNLVKIISDYPYYFFYPESSILEVMDASHSTLLEYKVEGEALDFIIALCEGEEKAFEDFIFTLAEADYEEKQRAETKLIFNNLDEMKLYFLEERNEFVFIGDVEFKFNLNVDSDIFVFGDIDGNDITAKNIEAWDINATNILADSIDAFRNLKAKNIFAEKLAVSGFCLVEEEIFCESIARL
jgi:hypothetical protein